MRKVLLALALLVPSAAHAEDCIASVYSTKDRDQNGTRTASGIPLDDGAVSVAHRTYHIRGWLRITNLKTGKQIVARVTDRGPYVPGRCVDLSVAAAKAVGINDLGKVRVEPKEK